jgi:glucose-1-phosphate cytidylyltransferase
MDNPLINMNYILIKNDSTLLEQEPFKQATKKRQLLAFKYQGFWQCMDTLSDKEILEKTLKSKNYFE